MSASNWPPLADAAWPLLIALMLGLLVQLLLLYVARRAQRKQGQHLRARIAEVVALPAAIGLPLLFLLAAVRRDTLSDAVAYRVEHALGVGVILCVTWLLVRTVGAIERRILRHNPLDIANNLHARGVQTQTRVLSRVAQGGLVLVGVSIALMTFPAIRQIGTTLLASAGIIGLVAGIAAKPVFGNLIAGLQIALTQPIRLDDVVIVQGEWGRIEEITSAYVVVRIWDERRLVVPLQWFIENPFQNWTRSTSQLLGTSFLWLDYRTPMADVRQALQHICETDERWDGRVCVAQVTDSDHASIQVRLLVSGRNSGDLFDLRCAVSERMIDYLNIHHPEALPRTRIDMARAPGADAKADAGSWDDHPPPMPASIDVAQTSSPGAEDVTPADLASSADISLRAPRA